MAFIRPIPLLILLLFLRLFTYPSLALIYIVDAIAAKERWDAKDGVRVADLDRGGSGCGARGGTRCGEGGRTTVAATFSDEAAGWRRAREGGDGVVVVEEGEDLVGGDGRVGLGLGAAIRDFELVGPFDLRVGGGDHDEIALHYPWVNQLVFDNYLNTTNVGLKRLLVGEGIKIKVAGAQQVSFSHPYDIGLSMNGILAPHDVGHCHIWPLSYPSCALLLSVDIVGSIRVFVQSTHTSRYKSSDTIELLPKKCYNKRPSSEISSCLFCSASSRLSLFDSVLIKVLRKRTFENNKPIRFLKAKVTAAAEVKFRIELEKRLTENDRTWKKIPAWKTKPRVDRVWLEVVARVEEGGRLKAVLLKKLGRSFSIDDSVAWSKMMSNVSFTQFPSFVVHPKALTLDVKW
uniref:Uncharacterized protein n=1 Tax=Ananas comosus var. bracteatus TaxID=296719 RepID=A0A6V7NLM7_ANACO|nr:unnamed protein product [Ananas comosus var. bracteatus]